VAVAGAACLSFSSALLPSSFSGSASDPASSLLSWLSSSSKSFSSSSSFEHSASLCAAEALAAVANDLRRFAPSPFFCARAFRSRCSAAFLRARSAGETERSIERLGLLLPPGEPGSPPRAPERNRARACCRRIASASSIIDASMRVAWRICNSKSAFLGGARACIICERGPDGDDEGEDDEAGLPSLEDMKCWSDRCCLPVGASLVGSSPAPSNPSARRRAR